MAQEEMVFDENTHTYTKGGNNYISVTTLLKKYNLSPDYGQIDPLILAQAAKRGTMIHKALEEFIKNGNNTLPMIINPFNQYVVQQNIDLHLAESEKLIYDDKYLIAGTIDFIYTNGKSMYIADFKTTSSVHYESVSWQLSIYNYINCKGNPKQYYKYKPQVIHIKPIDLNRTKYTFNFISLSLIPFEEVENLLNANLLGLPYTYVPDISNILTQTEQQNYKDLCNEIEQYKTLITQLEERRNEINKNILEKIKTNKIKNFSIDNIDITIKEEFETSKLNKKLLEAYCLNNGIDIKQFYITNKQDSSLIVKVNPIISTESDNTSVLDDLNKLANK